jgi:hypothetical protein
VEKEKTKQQQVALEIEKEKTKQAEIALEKLKLSPIHSRSSSGVTTPSRGKVAQMRSSVSAQKLGVAASDYVGSAPAAAASLDPEPDALKYYHKIVDIARRHEIYVSVTGGNLTFNNKKQNQIGQIKLETDSEQGCDAFYKKVYYFWFFECQLDIAKLAKDVKELVFTKYKIPRDSPRLSIENLHAPK